MFNIKETAKELLNMEWYAPKPRDSLSLLYIQLSPYWWCWYKAQGETVGGVNFDQFVKFFVIEKYNFIKEEHIF